MIVTNYLFEDPSQSLSIYLKDDEYLNAFEKYMDYMNTSSKNSTTIKFND